MATDRLSRAPDELPQRDRQALRAALEAETRESGTDHGAAGEPLGGRERLMRKTYAAAVLLALVVLVFGLLNVDAQTVGQAPAAPTASGVTPAAPRLAPGT